MPMLFLGLLFVGGCFHRLKVEKTAVPNKIVAVFIHGGPTQEDYLEPLLGSFFPNGLFYSQDVSNHKNQRDVLRELSGKLETIDKHSNIILVGHSWGSIVATLFLESEEASKNKELRKRIVGLVLVSGFLLSKQEESFISRFQALPEKDRLYTALLSDEELIAKNTVVFNGSNTSTRGFVDRLIETYDSEAHQRLIPKNFDYRNFIRDCSIPVLNIFGEQDRRHLSDHIEGFANLGKHVKNIKIMGAGATPFLLEHHRIELSEEISQFVLELSH